MSSDQAQESVVEERGLAPASRGPAPGSCAAALHPQARAVGAQAELAGVLGHETGHVVARAVPAVHGGRQAGRGPRLWLRRIARGPTLSLFDTEARNGQPESAAVPRSGKGIDV